MARLRSARRISATNVDFDRSRTFADERECVFSLYHAFRLTVAERP
jgi:hypothetical protein